MTENRRKTEAPKAFASGKLRAVRAERLYQTGFVTIFSRDELQ